MDASDPQANRTVAYNLRRARELHHWSQEQAAERISAHRPKPWTKQAVWTAEKSFTAEPRRVRKFDADELIAFTRAFGVPLGFFFLPPPASQQPDGRAPTVDELLPVITTNQNTYWQSFMGQLDVLLTEHAELWDQLRQREVEAYQAPVPQAKTRELMRAFTFVPDEDTIELATPPPDR
jgi:transcriptional regulator with XRE-family HTH domain